MTKITSSLTYLRRALVAVVTATPVIVGGMSLPMTAGAHDTEVFFSLENEVTAKPNVLFLLDTSATMWTVESSSGLTWDPAGSFNPGSGQCQDDKVYITWGSNPDPLETGCTGSIAAINLADIYCTDVVSALTTAQGINNVQLTVSQKVGTTWVIPSQSVTGILACKDQDGGNGPPIPAKGAKQAYRTAGGSANAINSGFSFYTGRYINFRRMPTNATKYRIDAIREVLAQVIKATPGINVGLARGATDSQLPNQPVSSPRFDGQYCEPLANNDESSGTGNGGMIVYPIKDVAGPGLQSPDNPDGFVGATAADQILYELGVDPVSLEVQPWKVNLLDPKRRLVDGNPCAIPLFTPNGRTPIGLTTYEAFLYYSGKDMKYGDQANVGPGFEYDSVLSSRVAPAESEKQYKSPILPENCGATNYIILLSDGTTEKDNENDQAIGSMVYGSGSKCDEEVYVPANYLTDQETAGWTDAQRAATKALFPLSQGASKCIDDLAGYMAFNDVGPPDGKQTVITHTVGFALDRNLMLGKPESELTPAQKASKLEAIQARELLAKIADRGAGSFYNVDNAEELFLSLTKIFREILTRNTSFTSPAVSVNAFNRTQNLNDLYVSLFRPDFAYRWNGNVKKYKVAGGFDPLCTGKITGGTTFCIVDQNGNLAVDGNGFFYDSASRKAQSFWSPAADGADIEAGGAANRLPNWAARTIYTNKNGVVRNVDLNASNLLALKTDAAFTDAALRTLFKIDPTDTRFPSNPRDMIDWLYGRDLVTNQTRHDMGDPLHTKPVAVIYGGTADAPNIRLFSLTNDGFVHSINPDDDSGVEQWAFVPWSMLPRTGQLYLNNAIQPEAREYGVDGPIRVVQSDLNRNGVVDGADKVYMYFGERRGGSRYYALDITDPDDPQLMWMLTANDLPGIGQSWSTPARARVKIGNTLHNALIFGGGYDTGHDDQPYLADPSQKGNRIFMVDAVDGTLLWSAGGPGSVANYGANLELPEMQHSIPGDIRVVDITGDGLADRMYAADLGGRVFRFDIYNGENMIASAAGTRFVEGGVLADLLMQANGTRDTTNPLRFFYSPDPALVTLGDATFINVAIGSGHRELPVSDAPDRTDNTAPYTTNWFFSIRDRNVFQQLKQADYQATCTSSPCHEIVKYSDLVDLSTTYGAAASAEVPLFTCPVGGCDDTNPPTYIKGWKIVMSEPGEKVLAESRTFGGNVFFTTYTPADRGLTNTGCATAVGRNRLYVVSALNAAAVNDWNRDGVVDDSERSRELGQSFTIAPEVVFIFPTPDASIEDCIGAECRPNPICLVGLESCGPGLLNAPVRTFWQQRGIN